MDHLKPYLCLLIIFLLEIILAITAQAPLASDLSDNSHKAQTQSSTILEPNLDISTNKRERSVTLGVGLPIPFTLGVLMPITKNLSIDTAFGYAPMPFFENYHLSDGGIEIKAEWQPFNSGFIVSGGFGYQFIQASTQINLQGLFTDLSTTPLNLSFSIFYETTSVGYKWNLNEKFWVSADIGIQIPILNTGTLSTANTSALGKDLQVASKDILNYLSGFVLPRANLIKLGFLF